MAQALLLITEPQSCHGQQALGDAAVDSEARGTGAAAADIKTLRLALEIISHCTWFSASQPPILCRPASQMAKLSLSIEAESYGVHFGCVNSVP